MKDLVCTEIRLEERGNNYSKTIKNLSTITDLLLSGGIGFSPSASILVYPERYKRLYLVDTRTWIEDEVMLDRKYSMLTGFLSMQRGNNWYELKFTKDEKDIYLLAKRADINRVSKDENKIAHFLLILNLETKQSQEIIGVPAMRLNPWIRIILASDEKSALLLGFGETYEDYGGVQNKMIALRKVDLTTKETKQFVYKHDGGRNVAWQMALLSEGLIAIALSESDQFLFVKLGKENK